MIPGRVRLADAPTMAAAVEGLLAIPTCATPGCDSETIPFTDRCDTCLTEPTTKETR